MTLFEKNWKLISRLLFNGEQPSRTPEPPEDSAEIEWTNSRTGDLSAKYRGTALHSLHNPRKEAERLIQREIQEDTDLVIFCGFGLGYAVESYLEAFPEGKAVILEPDPELFLQVMKRRDLTPVFNRDETHLLLQSPAELLTEVLKEYKREKIQLLYFRPTYKEHSEYWKTIDEIIRKFLARREINKNTLKKFGKRWVRNLASNLPHLPRSRPLRELKGRFQEIPALIIAAGPSLEADLDHLESFRERTLVICVDTALRSVLRRGISPDFVIVIDPQFWNSCHLDRLQAKESVLITDATTYPTVFRHFSEPFYLTPSSFPLSSRIEDALGITERLHSGGSVATAAWETARFLGCPEIWCSGLDLGFPGKQTHFKGSFFEERVHVLNYRLNPGENAAWHAYRDGEPFPVTDNRGNTVMTDHRLIIYRTWFQERAEMYPELPQFTLSPGGVAIKGLTLSQHDKLLERALVRDKIDVLLNEIKSPSPDNKQEILKRCLSGILQELEGIKELAKEGAAAVNNLEVQYRMGKPIQSELKKLDNIDRQLLETPAREIAAFTVQPAMEALSRQSGNILEDSRKLYATLEQSADFHIRLFSRKIN